MNHNEKRYIVAESALPKGLKAVVDARAMLLSGKVKTINRAVAMAGISRSAYYKYRNSIELFSDSYNSKIVTFQAVLTHRAGVLGALLSSLAKAGASVLTINQSIPVNGQAGITISLHTGSMRGTVEALAKKVASIDGVISAEIMQSET